MPLPRRADTDATTALLRDSADNAETARKMRTSLALAGLPSSRVRVVTEQNDAGQIRVGLRNNATGNVAWLTEWF
jgi:hypothetical protein